MFPILMLILQILVKKNLGTIFRLIPKLKAILILVQECYFLFGKNFKKL